MTEDCYCLKGQLVGGSENANWNFTSVGNEDLVHLHDGAVRPQASVHGVGMLVGISVSMWSAIIIVLLRVGHGEVEVNGSTGRMTWLVVQALFGGGIAGGS